MTFQQELSSWFSPSSPHVDPSPSIGNKAPSSPRLELQGGRPAVITFLRHCGCPFAEKSFLRLRETAAGHRDVDFVAVSHSSPEHTKKWLESLPQAGTEPSNFRTVVDDKLEIYAAWGLGLASWAHVLSPSALYEVYRLARDEGIKNRPTESGSRWQASGAWAVDGNGVVRWGRPSERTDDIPDYEDAVRKLNDDAKNQAKL